MHPAIRILVLLALAAGAGRAAPGGVALMLAGVAAAWLATPGLGWRAAAGQLRRLRWLLAAVLVAYVGFTPGEPLWPELPWSPSRAGLEAGLLRAGALAALALAVQVLVARTPVPVLVAGLRWLLAPCGARLAGQLALRLALTLEAVGPARERALAAAAAAGARPGALVRAAGALWRETLHEAAVRPLELVAVPQAAAPRPWEWLLPAAVLAVLLLA